MAAANSSFEPFHGSESRALDAKNRATVPSGWSVAEGAEFFLVPDRTSTFLHVMPPPYFNAVDKRLASNTTMSAAKRAVFQRQFFSRARRVFTDSQRRLLIPDELRKQLELRENVWFVGAGETFQIWSDARWSAQTAADESTYAEVAEELGL